MLLKQTRQGCNSRLHCPFHWFNGTVIIEPLWPPVLRSLPANDIHSYLPKDHRYLRYELFTLSSNRRSFPFLASLETKLKDSRTMQRTLDQNPILFKSNRWRGDNWRGRCCLVVHLRWCSLGNANKFLISLFNISIIILLVTTSANQMSIRGHFPILAPIK